MKIMPPHREPSIEDSASTVSAPIQDLAHALRELLHLQQRQATTPMQLDTHFQLSKFFGQMNGETVDSWLHSLSTYFKTCPVMEEDMKLYIASLRLEGIAQAWWDTQNENFSESTYTTSLLGTTFVKRYATAFIPQDISRTSLLNGCSFDNYSVSQYIATSMSSTNYAFSCTFQIRRST